MVASDPRAREHICDTFGYMAEVVRAIGGNVSSSRERERECVWWLLRSLHAAAGFNVLGNVVIELKNA